MCSVTERLAGVVRVGAKPASRLAGRCGGGKPAWNRRRGTGKLGFINNIQKCREMSHTCIKSHPRFSISGLRGKLRGDNIINAATLRGPRCAHRREPGGY
jgi:hypothetical protein